MAPLAFDTARTDDEVFARLEHLHRQATELETLPIDEEAHERAWGILDETFAVVAEVNAPQPAAIETNKLVEKLKKWVEKLRHLLATLVEVLAAASFSIGVSATGLSVSVTFDRP